MSAMVSLNRSFSHKSILHINFIQEKHGVEFIEGMKKGNAGIQNV